MQVKKANNERQAKQRKRNLMTGDIAKTTVDLANAEAERDHTLRQLNEQQKAGNVPALIQVDRTVLGFRQKLAHFETKLAQADAAAPAPAPAPARNRNFQRSGSEEEEEDKLDGGDDAANANSLKPRGGDIHSTAGPAENFNRSSRDPEPREPYDPDAYDLLDYYNGDAAAPSGPGDDAGHK